MLVITPHPAADWQNGNCRACQTRAGWKPKTDFRIVNRSFT